MRLLPLIFLVICLSVARAQTNAAPPAASAPAPAASAATTNAPSADDAKAAENQRQLRMAGEKAHAGDTDGAVAQINGVLQNDPRNVAAFSLRAQIYNEKKMWDKAANDYQAAHLIDPTNVIINFNIAEVQFEQKMYDAARLGFVSLQSDHTTDIGDLAAYKVFLCDLLGGHEDVAAKELDAFNQVGSKASYYYSNAAWSLFHHKVEDARSWLTSASHIYSPNKNSLYSTTLAELGYLPLPPPPG
jgi:Tfp pilus assembly protein PilF